MDDKRHPAEPQGGWKETVSYLGQKAILMDTRPWASCRARLPAIKKDCIMCLHQMALRRDWDLLAKKIEVCFSVSLPFLTLPLVFSFTGPFSLLFPAMQIFTTYRTPKAPLTSPETKDLTFFKGHLVEDDGSKALVHCERRKPNA
uniref:Rhodanese domain-containing protein n=1 Tax=Parascaris equorum TaxID=6256 RepID=A0A914RXI0_PAREQ